jgi:hypothetical protein
VGGYFYWWFLEDVVNANHDASEGRREEIRGEKCLRMKTSFEPHFDERPGSKD